MRYCLHQEEGPCNICDFDMPLVDLFIKLLDVLLVETAAIRDSDTPYRLVREIRDMAERLRQ